MSAQHNLMMISLNVRGLKNLSSNATLLNPKSQKSEDLKQITEFGPKSVWIELPERFCAIGSHLLLTIEVNTYGNVHDFEATGKVIKKESPESGFCLTEIELAQYDIDIWTEFLNEIKAQQERAIELFEQVKGNK